MRRRKRKKRPQDAVELNLAAMLDMAFQLLTFFILTFKPAPVEGQISLRMPPPASIMPAAGQAAGADTQSSDPLQGLKTLSISVMPSKEGGIASIMVNQDLVGSLNRLDQKLREIFSNPSSPFDQVVIQAGSGLRYDALMSIVDVCTRQKLSSGKPLTKLSFAELVDDSFEPPESD